MLENLREKPDDEILKLLQSVRNRSKRKDDLGRDFSVSEKMDR